MNFALITGASKGIGKEMAIELAKKKYNLILVARSEDVLQALCKEISAAFAVECNYIATDLSTSKGIDKVVAYVESKKIPVSVLINNAGYGLWGKLENQSIDATKDMMQLNMVTMVELTQRLIPTLKQSSSQSYIMNVASTAAYQAVPTLAVYAATKAGTNTSIEYLP